ncbi:MAG: UvrABC system protein A [bacterium ADurb.Bin212]|nr:MAG: UvrABC system protein A [bacterium ADurb.Bin212]
MNKIKIEGAREHNLKNISLEIPREKLVVITGLSGSGKSSLAFDTIYAEGQRRYVESLSSYARQFLGVMQKPDVDYIEGLSPAISIDQKSASRNPRSTVGTITEIYDYLRLLYARVGTPHCPKCGKAVSRQSIAEISNLILKSHKKTSRIAILSPLVVDKKGEHKHVFAQIAKAGFSRVRMDGTIMDLEEAENFELDKQKKHSIEVVVDRLIIEPKEIDEDNRKRLYDSVEKAVEISGGKIISYNYEDNKEEFFSENLACAECGISIPDIAPRMFSFNSPHGACSNCQGLGSVREIDPKLVIPNPRLSVLEGAIRPWVRNSSNSPWYFAILEAAGRYHKIDLSKKVKDLSKDELRIILYGTNGQKYIARGHEVVYEGVIPNMNRRYKETDSDYVRKEIEKYMVTKKCPVCSGGRLRAEALGVKIDEANIVEVSSYTIDKLLIFFESLPKKLSDSQNEIAKQIVKEIALRSRFLIDVGLSYLTIDRNAATLAGGEAQRIRLATQIGSGLMGVLYILDEPSIGLHQRDNGRLLGTLKRLRDIGNSVIIVEHDEETMREADYIVDIGPGAGEHGGKVVCQGTPLEVMKSSCSVTADYLSGKKKINIPSVRRLGSGNHLEVVGAREHNLKNINVKIPLNTFVCVTGVSGSGKSTLVNDILSKELARRFHRAESVPGEHDEILGLENLNKIISIDQSPIGKSPRSNPATYTGAFTPIRELFASTQEARMRGYKAGRFSFNVKGGRCEKCRGDGVIKIEMHFLPDIYITCEECKGKRYNQEALEVKYKGKTIAEVLDMTVEEAETFFKNIPSIHAKMSVLNQVGLGYIRLGQPATTLSGGEAQRIKLASELSRRGTGSTLYVLDEPTTGLHFEDIKKLLSVLNSLVDKGNTVLVIEHNLDVIKSSDYIIDIGPEGGDKGGTVIACGTPEDVAKIAISYTGQYLKKILKS